MEDLRTKAIEIDAWREGYKEGLEEALKIVNSTARFGIEKTVSGIEQELENFKVNNVTTNNT